MQPATLFTIDIRGVPREIFQVQQRSENGDLTIVLRKGRYRTDSDTYKVKSDGHEYVEHRISVHSSPQSKTGINALVHTVNLKDGSEFPTRNYTRAIKATNRFACLITERCRDMNIPSHAISGTKNPLVSLGSYSADLFQLVYGIFVGRADRTFSPGTLLDQNQIKFIQVPFIHPLGEYSVVVLWSFIGLPSNGSSNYTSFKTARPEDIETITDPGLQQYLRDAADGYDEEGCLVYYWVKRDDLLKQYLNNRESDSPQDAKILIPALRTIARFFMNGDPTAPDFLEHFRRMRDHFGEQGIAQLQEHFTQRLAGKEPNISE
jgi:hypothetical protein